MDLMAVCDVSLALLSPLGTSLILGALAILLALSGAEIKAFLAGLLGLAWLWTWSLPAVSDAARWVVEREFPPLSMQSVPAGKALVVLGGGMLPSDARYPEPCLSSVERLRSAARLYHAGKTPLLVLSGGGDGSTEAWAMSVMLREFGVPQDAMLLEATSRTTSESARYSAKLLRERGIETVLLVTSAMHMGRAVRHFSNEGIWVVPVATGHEARGVVAWRRWIPDIEALEGSGRAMREWIGQRMPLYGRAHEKIRANGTSN